MSWASVYWDLDHIVQAAREAMESTYALEAAGQTQTSSLSNSTASNVSVESSVVNVDSLAATLEDLSMSIDSSALASDQATTHAPPKDAIDTLAASLRRSSLETGTLTIDAANVQTRSLWTPEIEAALRAFLRPLSVDLRYEYRFQDTLDERRSIAMINDLFTRRAKPDETEMRDMSERVELRRKRNDDLRRSRFAAAITKKS